jgi:predicted transcriptional regulator
VRSRRNGGRESGLARLRRSGSVTELLFLYDIVTRESDRLAPIAERLGLTVQAVSHSFRQLRRRGLAEFRGGRYRSTVEGVAWLHAALGAVRDDASARLERLHVVRSCRAVALEDLPEGERVSLELRDGVLSARRGSRRSGSTGRTEASASAGALARVVELEGILPITRGRVRVLTLSGPALDDRDSLRRLGREVGRDATAGLLAAQGHEAYHLLRRTTSRPVVRFGVGPAVTEASRLGLDSTVVVLEEELPRLLEALSGRDPPPLRIVHLRGPRSGGGRRPRRARIEGR